MSIKIVDNNNPRARAEVRERLSDVLAHASAAARAEPAPEGFESDTVRDFRAQVGALLYALTGYQPTADEIKEVIGG